MRSAGNFQIFKSDNSEDPASSMDDEQKLKKGIISYIMSLQNKDKKEEIKPLEEVKNIEKKTDSHKGGSYMSDGGSNKESNKSKMKKNKKLAATRGRKNFNEFYD
jgi:hypothetical protein